MNHSVCNTALPSGWEVIEKINNKIIIDRLEIFVSGICAKNAQIKQMAIGSKASLSEFKDEIAGYELLERVSTIEYHHNNHELNTRSKDLIYLNPAANEFNLSKSNGFALHSSSSLASLSARYELLERHIILQSWYGAEAPKKIEGFRNRDLDKLSAEYQYEAYKFLNESGVEVTMICLYPLLDKNPFIYGFGCHKILENSLAKSVEESIQRLAFLFGEEIEENVQFSASPFYHQEVFLGPEGIVKFTSWIRGEHQRLLKAPIFENKVTLEDIQLENITPKWIGSNLYVFRAYGKDIIDLYFGNFLNESFLSKDSTFYIHPIA